MGWYLVGLFGEHISQSRSPQMHEREAAAQSCKLAYQLYDFSELNKTTADLGALLDAAFHMGFAGLNITHPFKRDVLKFLDAVSAEAEAIGAVNTVLFKDGKKTGYNTDCLGFLSAFEEELGEEKRQSVLLLGAGGAGVAVAEALMKLGVSKLCIHDKQEALTQSLLQKLSDRHPDRQIRGITAQELHSLDVDGIVNATPVGMREYPGLPISAECVQRQHWLADIIYFPLQTALLEHAGKLGCRTMNGARMAVYQAAEAFTLFTGLQADKARMLQGFHQQ